MSTEPNSTDVEDDEKYPSNFIRTIIEKDVAAGKNSGQVVTRLNGLRFVMRLTILINSTNLLSS